MSSRVYLFIYQLISYQASHCLNRKKKYCCVNDSLLACSVQSCRYDQMLRIALDKHSLTCSSIKTLQSFHFQFEYWFFNYYTFKITYEFQAYISETIYKLRKEKLENRLYIKSWQISHFKFYICLSLVIILRIHNKFYNYVNVYNVRLLCIFQIKEHCQSVPPTFLKWSKLCHSVFRKKWRILVVWIGALSSWMTRNIIDVMKYSCAER